eukprot:m.130849 g.130849  ORF g.130849 m.130849 type:complete len:85 (+) comp22384_c0_seq1:3876-4130(+)
MRQPDCSGIVMRPSTDAPSASASAGGGAPLCFDALAAFLAAFASFFARRDEALESKSPPSLPSKLCRELIVAYTIHTTTVNPNS